MKTLAELDGTKWQGKCELWLDPLGDEVTLSDCTLSVTGNELTYEWEYQGKQHRGALIVREGGADFTDSFHSETTMPCESVAAARGLLQVLGSYGPEADWGWRIALVYRAPTEQLILQMTNIAPRGEEARAVRITHQAA
jgi:hypothetical protein